MKEWLAVSIAALALLLTVSAQISAAGGDSARTTTRVQSLEQRVGKLEDRFERIDTRLNEIHLIAASASQTLDWMKRWISASERGR